jgi:hypothetical protein
MRTFRTWTDVHRCGCIRGCTRAISRGECVRRRCRRLLAGVVDAVPRTRWCDIKRALPMLTRHEVCARWCECGATRRARRFQRASMLQRIRLDRRVRVRRRACRVSIEGRSVSLPPLVRCRRVLSIDAHRRGVCGGASTSRAAQPLFALVLLRRIEGTENKRSRNSTSIAASTPIGVQTVGMDCR